MKHFKLLALATLAGLKITDHTFAQDLGFRSIWGKTELVSPKGSEGLQYTGALCNVRMPFYPYYEVNTCQHRQSSCRIPTNDSQWGYNSNGLSHCSKLNGLSAPNSTIHGLHAYDLILRNSNLSNSDFRYSNFHELFAVGSNLSNSNFFSVNFWNANLSGVAAVNSHFERSDFRIRAGYANHVWWTYPRNQYNKDYATYFGSNFSGSKFNEAFVRANIAGSNLNSTDFHRVGRYWNAGKNLDYLSIQASTMHYASLMDAVLTGSDFEAVDATHLNAERANLQDSWFESSDFQYSNFRETDLSYSFFVSRNMNRKLNFSHSDLSNANLSNSNIGWSHLNTAPTDIVILQNSKFTSANFDNTRIYLSTWKNSDFTDASIKNAAFCSADFSNTNLAKARTLSGTTYDSYTLLPFSDAEAEARGMIKLGKPCI